MHLTFVTDLKLTRFLHRTNLSKHRTVNMANEEDDIIQRTCGTLQRYYESLNEEYEEGYFLAMV